MPDWLPHKIVSGGQTGADRAALDWACEYDIAHSGWCPRGRLAADGPLPPKYQLQETESDGYRQRTKLNVRDSDATLIFNIGELTAGSLLTKRFAETLGKPHIVVQLEPQRLAVAAGQVIAWLRQSKFSTLNIAGPSEARQPGIHGLVLAVLKLCAEAAD
jgi:hypothetical protein